MIRLVVDGSRYLAKNGVMSFIATVNQYIKRDLQYGTWIENNEPGEGDLSALSEECRSFGYRPRISIIMPTWNTDEKWLRRAIESLLSQVYDNWELCIADGSSEKPHVQRILSECACKDPRIKVKLLKDNKGIAGNSNEALSLATGEFVGFLDHDDELLPFALYEVAKVLNKYNYLDLIYSDEDKIDGKGKRSEPFFKPDWSPDLFNSCNYMCHFTLIPMRILEEIGGFAAGYDGSQDYDLFLRATENIDRDRIYHIPKILYHWRMIPGSAAASCNAKPYAYIAAKKALTDSMTRRGIGISEVADGSGTGIYRIKYSLIDEPRVSIIIASRDNAEGLKNCIQSIFKKTQYDNFEIAIVDNKGRKEETQKYYGDLAKVERVKLLYYDHDFNYSAMNNFAVSKTSSDYILFLNDHTEVISGGWLSAMLEHAQRKEVGAVGGKLLLKSKLFKNESIQHCGMALGLGAHGVAGHVYYKWPDINGYMGLNNIIRNCSAVTAACMLTKRSIFERVGGFDEVNLPMAFGEVDFCLKLRRCGYYVVYTPYAQMYYHESSGRGRDNSPDAQKRSMEEANYMKRKWGETLDNDPFYNPNLSKTRGDYSIRL
ncbi:Glycosyl transferase family 2 [uncultured archaeon]|nr:Glycosyl transferase family 2 [uncultured archaeon]